MADDLKHTVTIRASEEFKQRLLGLTKEATTLVEGTIKMSDLVRIGLDWVLLHSPQQVVAFLVGDEKLEDHL